MRRHSSIRRGLSTVQVCLMIGLIALAIVASVSLLGSSTNTKLEETASDMANPKNLTKRFGS